MGAETQIGTLVNSAALGPAPAPIIKPTVGRMVYFKSHGSPLLPDGTSKYQSRDLAAIITEVKERDGEEPLVSLCVFYNNGNSFKQDCNQGQEPGQWDWMPFQKDQQARLAK